MSKWPPSWPAASVAPVGRGCDLQPADGRSPDAAARRKGKWTGGTPILGHDVDRSNGPPRLMVNAQEAARVREIFRLYLSLGTLLPVVKELACRGWQNKAWKTKRGQLKGGRPFDKRSL